MADTPEVKTETQSGSKIGLGILGFIVGLLLLLWILKMILGV